MVMGGIPLISKVGDVQCKHLSFFFLHQKIFLIHLKVMVRTLYGTILNSYGNPWLICPSPMLSCLLEGCIDSGKDMTNGGSRYST